MDLLKALKEVNCLNIENGSRGRKDMEGPVHHLWMNPCTSWCDAFFTSGCVSKVATHPFFQYFVAAVQKMIILLTVFNYLC